MVSVEVALELFNAVFYLGSADIGPGSCPTIVACPSIPDPPDP